MKIENPLLTTKPDISKLLHNVQSKCGSLRGAAATLTQKMSAADTKRFLEGMSRKAQEIVQAVERLRNKIEGPEDSLG